MKIERNGVIYKLDKANRTAKIVGYCATDIYEQVIPSVVKSFILTFNVTEISDDAFKYTDVRKVILPETIERIGNFAFYASAISYISRKSNKPLVIENHAFSDCKELKSVEFGGTVTFTGEHQFDNCYNLQQIDSKNIQGTIYNGTFSNCTKLEEFHFNDNVVVHPFAFFCTNLKHVFIGNNVKIRGGVQNTLNTTNILCHANSDMVDLAYEGYNISIIEDN